MRVSLGLLAFAFAVDFRAGFSPLGAWYFSITWVTMARAVSPLAADILAAVAFRLSVISPRSAGFSFPRGGDTLVK